MGGPKQNEECVSSSLHHDFVSIIDIDTFRRGLATQSAAIEGEPAKSRSFFLWRVRDRNDTCELIPEVQHEVVDAIGHVARRNAVRCFIVSINI